MTKAAFTPGPWRVEVDNVFAGPITNSIYVADCNPMNVRDAGGSDASTNPTSEANAALIAAAPALYEALAEIVHNTDYGAVQPRYMDAARAALSLARGES